MRNAFIMRPHPDVAEFMQAQARVSNRSVTNLAETMLLPEKARFEETQRELSVQIAPELLQEPVHHVIRDPQESDEEYAAGVAVFEAVLAIARRG